MKAYSKRALFSVGLGILGVFCAQIGAAWAFLGAVLLGMVSLFASFKAVRLIFIHPGPFWGKAVSFLVALAGALVAVLCLLVSLGMLLQPWVWQPRHQPRWANGQGPGAVNPLPAEPAIHFTSNLPIIVVDTLGHPDAPERDASVRAKFFDAHPARASLDAPPDYDGAGTLRIRGYSSRGLPKHSYTFHTVDSQGNQIKVPLLGLPPGSDWVLYAPYEDKTLVRDVLAYELARQMGHYAPRTRYVELFIRTAQSPLSMRDYAGVYVLIEKIKRGKDRVNIAKLEPQDDSEPDISGGYIIKRDHAERSAGHFRTQRGGPYFYVYPQAETITAKQKAWLRAYLNQFETALYGEDFQDPQRGYAAYLDVDAFIDAHWLIEMSKNIDGFRYSAYLIKDRGGKLTPGPPWDWNRAFGNANYHNGGQTHGWYSSLLRPQEICWYRRLQEDPLFSQRSARRWWELRRQVLDVKSIQGRIDQLAAQLEEAQRRNFQRWPVLGQQVTCNYYVGNTYAEEIQWLKTWIERRIGWIDQQTRPPSK